MRKLSNKKGGAGRARCEKREERHISDAHRLMTKEFKEIRERKGRWLHFETWKIMKMVTISLKWIRVLNRLKYYTLKRFMDRDLVVLSPVKAQGSVQKRKWKGCKLQRWWTTPRRQCLPDTAEQKHTQTHRDCKHGQDLRRSEQDKSQRWEGRVETTSPP